MKSKNPIINEEDLRIIARECARLRKLHKDPEAALKISQEVIDTINERKSRDFYERILCAHGGACRELGKSVKALHFAELAIKENPACSHPYNLAGGACADIGDEEGRNKYFEIAREKGATEIQIRKALIRQPVKSESRKAFNERYEYIDYGEFEDENLIYEREEENRMIDEELADFTESMDASSEDGWFYKD